MSSIAPLASREISEALKAKGIDMLDAPVSGGEPKAIDGTLSVMVGGDKAIFDKYYDLMKADGRLRSAYRRYWRGQRHQTG
ncbi:tartronate semialdehyde reductase [Klebsiella pneumoniae]|uniref:Tartronate semialdehyde reductase n=1 Tax=Klebsiella pneumoniae TaxID=573 RepID=A0A2X3EQY8_KLEPN|nr:tartronate semialdehyde reductase [Klebsiella pneumoniae]